MEKPSRNHFDHVMKGSFVSVATSNKMCLSVTFMGCILFDIPNFGVEAKILLDSYESCGSRPEMLLNIFIVHRTVPHNKVSSLKYQWCAVEKPWVR